MIKLENIKAVSSDGTVDTQQKLQWKNSLVNLEHIMNIYKKWSAQDTTSENDIQEVVKALEQVRSSHTDYMVRLYWYRKVKEFREANTESK